MTSDREGRSEQPWREGLEEGYWEALLSEEENAAEVTPEDLRDGEMAVGEDTEDWAGAQSHLDSGEPLELEVISFNRGGVLVRLGGLQGFVPTSHVVGLPRRLSAAEREERLAQRVGQRIRVRVIDLDRGRNRLVLSEREAFGGRIDPTRLEEVFRDGEICRGRVSNLCSFGAFVDLGGIEGLIHVSELSWRRVEDPAEVLQLGQELSAYVLRVDPERKRIALSLKRLQQDPWSTVESRYRVGQIVEGVVTNVVSFGAFARIEDGLEGLIHVSEMGDGNSFLPASQMVREGDRLDLRILHIDSGNHRLGLSMRQLANWDGHETTGGGDGPEEG